MIRVTHLQTMLSQTASRPWLSSIWAIGFSGTSRNRSWLRSPLKVHRKLPVLYNSNCHSPSHFPRQPKVLDSVHLARIESTHVPVPAGRDDEVIGAEFECSRLERGENVFEFKITSYQCFKSFSLTGAECPSKAVFNSGRAFSLRKNHLAIRLSLPALISSGWPSRKWSQRTGLPRWASPS